MKANKLIYFLIFIISCSLQEEPPMLTIGTAANMQYAMKDLTAAFKQETGIACKTVVSSSGKLTAQIQQGAPLDILVSADLKYPRQLYDKGLVLEPPQVYAYGRLILWTQLPDLSLEPHSLLGNQITHVAMANPQTAPYGQATQEFLQNTDLWEQLAPKLVYGESIAQTNQFILSQAVEVGITSQSVIMAPDLQHKGHWEYLDTMYYQPIAQSLAILSTRTQLRTEARKFQEFLTSDTGREILKKYGYLLPG